MTLTFSSILCWWWCGYRIHCNRQIKLNLKSIVLGVLLVFCLSCFVLTESTKTIDSHLSNADLQRLDSVFADALSSSDIQSIYYGALHIKDLQKKHADLCPTVTKLHQESKMNVSALNNSPTTNSSWFSINCSLCRNSRKTFISSTSTRRLPVRLRYPIPFKQQFHWKRNLLTVRKCTSTINQRKLSASK